MRLNYGDLMPRFIDRVYLDGTKFSKEDYLEEVTSLYCSRFAPAKKYENCVNEIARFLLLLDAIETIDKRLGIK